MLTVQGVKGFSTLIILKQLNPSGRFRGSGSGPMGSSFPRHGARIRTNTQRERKIKTKDRLQISTKTEYRIKIYMMHEQVK